MVNNVTELHSVLHSGNVNSLFAWYLFLHDMEYVFVLVSV